MRYVVTPQMIEDAQDVWATINNTPHAYIPCKGNEPPMRIQLLACSYCKSPKESAVCAGCGARA